MLFFKSQSLLGRIVNHTMFFSLRDFLSLLWFQTNFIVFARFGLSSIEREQIDCLRARCADIFFLWANINTMSRQISLDNCQSRLICWWTFDRSAVVCLEIDRLSNTQSQLLACVEDASQVDSYPSYQLPKNFSLELMINLFLSRPHPSNPWYITNDLLTH